MDCHRCGYPDLVTVHVHEGHAYGPECIEVVRHGARDLISEARAARSEVRRYRATCDRCDTYLGGMFTKHEHREHLRRHKLACR